MNNNIKRVIILFICLVFVRYLYGQNISYQDSIQIEYAASMHNLGFKHLSSNDFKSAYEYTQKAVEIRRELLGENNMII